MIAEIKGVIDVAKTLIELVKDSRDLIPDETEKKHIEKQLMLAERELALAEASTAKDLGYELCQCTFPPQIMLFTGKDKTFKCPSCGHKVDKSLVAMVSTVKRSDFFNDY